MNFFKSKKSQDRGLTSRDGAPPGSTSSLQGAAARVRDEKSRATPTGSLTSLDNDGSAGSPDQGFARRPGVADQAQQQASDLPVSTNNYSFPSMGCCLRIETPDFLRRHSSGMGQYRIPMPLCTLGRNGG